MTNLDSANNISAVEKEVQRWRLVRLNVRLRGAHWSEVTGKVSMGEWDESEGCVPAAECKPVGDPARNVQRISAQKVALSKMSASWNFPSAMCPATLTALIKVLWRRCTFYFPHQQATTNASRQIIWSQLCTLKDF